MLSSNRYDLIVVGGGPAGTAASITAARRGLRVLLLEAGAYPRHKVCGEFISPDALVMLQTLLGAEDFATLSRQAPRIRDIRLLPATSPETILPFPEPALSIPRYDLDAALWSAAKKAGADCHDHSRADALQHQDALWQVSCNQRQFLANHLLLATGRWSNLPRRSLPSRINRWMGVKAQFYESNPAPSCDLYFFPGGYCGVQPVAHDRVNVAAMIRTDIAKSLPEAFARHKALAERSASWNTVFPPLSCAPLLHAKPAVSKDGALLAGDAAAFIDPFVGDGISLALHSGCIAAEVICSTPEHAVDNYAIRYQREFAAAFRNAARLRKLTAAPALVQRLALAALRLSPIQEKVISATRVAR